MSRLVAKMFVAALVLSLLSVCNPLNSRVLAGEKPQKTATAPTSPCNTCLLFLDDRLGRTNELGNPLYTLKAYHNGQLIYSFNAVAGRWNTQGRNRHVSGTEAPLPNGNYRVSDRSIPGTIVEVGGLFLPIYPLFQTGRTALGIHYDPSYNLRNGEDGTSGCIGLTNRSDFEQILYFVETYKPQTLIVNLQ